MKKILSMVLSILLIFVAYQFIVSGEYSFGIGNKTNRIGAVESTEYKSEKLDNIEINSNLWLINSKTSIPVDYVPGLVSAYKIVPVSTSDIELSKVALDSIDKMFEDASMVGLDGFIVTSGYRTYDEQKQLYDESADKTYVQTPGNSEHETGLAADIAYMGVDSNRLGDSEPGKWLEENAWKYGLILRYPQNKEEITGISYEPWHFRYVGLPHSYICYNENICYEEYLEKLKQVQFCSEEVYNRLYTVYFDKGTGGYIDVPVNKEYSVSGDNIKGYIITVIE